MRTVLLSLKGAFRGVLRVAFEEAECARDRNDDNRDTRAWKLFLLLPRMWLSRPFRGGRVPRIGGAVPEVQRSQWAELIEASASLSTRGSEAAVRRRRRDQGDNVSKRAERALELVQMGELSTGLSVLEGAQIAPGHDGTYKALTDARRKSAFVTVHRMKIGLCSMCGEPGEEQQPDLRACWQIIAACVGHCQGHCWHADTFSRPQWKPSGWP